MALESCGTLTAEKIDLAFRLLHDLIRDSVNLEVPEYREFRVGEPGIWAVYPAILDGKPCVEIRIGVG